MTSPDVCIIAPEWVTNVLDIDWASENVGRIAIVENTSTNESSKIITEERLNLNS